MFGHGFNEIGVVTEVDGGGWGRLTASTRGNNSAVKIDGITFSFIGWFNTARDSHVLNLV